MIKNENRKKRINKNNSNDSLDSSNFEIDLDEIKTICSNSSTPPSSPPTNNNSDSDDDINIEIYTIDCTNPHPKLDKVKKNLFTEISSNLSLKLPPNPPPLIRQPIKTIMNSKFKFDVINDMIKNNCNNDIVNELKYFWHI